LASAPDRQQLAELVYTLGVVPEVACVIGDAIW
jgi:hypothetical protein